MDKEKDFYFINSGYISFYTEFGDQVWLPCIETVCNFLNDLKRKNNALIEKLQNARKEERKRVCKQIKDIAGDYFEQPYADEDVILTGDDFAEIIERVEKGETK